MSIKREAAFVLGAVALQEKDRIVSFLTEHSGKKRGVVRGARRLQSTFAGSLEPMSEVTIVYFEREGRELVRIDAADLIRSSFPLARDLSSALLLSALAEQLTTFVSDSDPSEKFFRLARHAIDALTARIAPPVVAAYVDVWTLKLSGILPEATRCASCGRALAESSAALDPNADGFVCRGCAGAGSIRIPPAFFSGLSQILQRGLTDLELSARELAMLSEVAGRLRRRFLGHELKSRAVLDRVMVSGRMLDSAP